MMVDIWSARHTNTYNDNSDYNYDNINAIRAAANECISFGYKGKQNNNIFFFFCKGVIVQLFSRSI